MGAKIVVIGSINMDLVCRAGRIPAPGETVLGEDLQLIPGGKGANQAVAAARLGGDVLMVGRVGDDGFGATLLNGLKTNGVDTRHVMPTKGTPSGCALITVSAKGENSIVVSPGANAKLTPKDVDAAKDAIAGASAVVMQLEIPLKTVAHAIRLCRKLGVRTILDPAPVPAGGLPKALYGVDILSPNQTEARDLVRGRGDDERIGRMLLKRGAKLVLLKQGADGATAIREDLILSMPSFRVKAIDTTAAGDAFTAALAVALGGRKELAYALRFANAAGALCCTKFGAQPALPGREQVLRLLAAGRV